MILLLKSIFQPILRDKSIYLICIFTSIAYSIYYLFLGGFPYDLNKFLLIFMQATVFTGIAFIIMYFFYLMIKLDPHPINSYLRLIKLPFIYWRESINFFLLCIAISIILSVFSSVKSSIPIAIPFYLDSTLVELDLFLHFGYAPWEITHFIFSSPVSTAILNFLYNFWFFLCWSFLIVLMCWVNRPGIRRQALICFCLIWIINGNVLAVLLSSAGPCFYSMIGSGSDTYIELMSRLNEQNDWLLNNNRFFNVWALKTQDILWESYVQSNHGITSGISAMPSMHISVASLIAMTIYHFNKTFGGIAWGYALLIMVGSVHLGWHYAVDGYFALMLTSIIWFSVKRILARYPLKDTANKP
ncbi:phosphatase PAP2 family protein [Marinomonas sp. 15G1-11]|uniref:Phosphatase PAP2 family protein n=1 Tax=Marinomonas phaeophyticola TaxID=3004091 RepID=A0ABT4JT84_9GAMM|nr:phosphatase PAP2 family protein [Marinomonas sp. 15G1-11]MCZ2721584.1 phosphatase PAP2 family protein [Marinomonas sp. 15G1-11]